jgi:ferric-dicitrate binding protein FerR (iron transport regulator)
VTRDELLRLLGGLCDGTLSPGEHRALESHLASSEEARRLYFDYLDVHLGMRRVRVEASGSKLRRASWIAGLAASLILAWIVFRLRPDAPDAVLVQSASARFFGQSLVAGQALESGREIALTAGRIELRFRSGVEAVLQGPAAFVVRDAMSLSVKYGRCSVHVVPGAEGFVVETPSTRILDRGTRFAVDVGEGGETEVQMLEGKAEVSGPGAAAQTLVEGVGRRFGPGSIREVEFDRKSGIEMPDRVVSFATTKRNGLAQDLVSVVVRRGGEVRTYAARDLIGVKLIHFKSSPRAGNFTATPRGVPDPGPGRRAALIEDDLDLNTGVINPGGSRTPLEADPIMNDPEDPSRPNTPGMAIRFARPVRNEAGPDVVFFEFQPVIQPEDGDPFHASPLRFEPGLRSKTLLRWDLGTYSPEAPTCLGFRLNHFKRPVGSKGDHDAAACAGGTDFMVTSKILAVGLDLSDLGYAPGREVEGLFLQDVLDDGHHVDFTVIGGLPPLEGSR